MNDGSSLEAAIDGLYALPLAEFTAMRDALAKRLRTAGDRAGADRIRGLRKPNVSAWAVNQLWWTEREAFTALLDAGEAVRAAQARGAGPAEQREHDRERRDAVQRLLARARALLGGEKDPPAAVLRRITTTLEACAARGHAPSDPPPGRLHDDLDPPGFDVLARLAAAVHPTASEETSAPAWTNTEASTDELSLARERLDAAKARVQELARALDDATATADQARTLAASTKTALEQAERAAEAAARALTHARREHETSTERLADSERTLASLQEQAVHARAAAQEHTLAWERMRERLAPPSKPG